MKWARYHINGLEIHAFVGVYEEEKRTGNDFLVDISYAAPYEEAADSDRLEQAVNYGDICWLAEDVFQKRCNLLEQIAWDLVRSLKQRFPEIRDISVTVTKLRPPVSQTVKGISITISDDTSVT